VARCEMKSHERQAFAAVSNMTHSDLEAFVDDLEVEDRHAAQNEVIPATEQQQQEAEQLQLLGRGFESWQWAEVWEWMMSLQSGKLLRYAVVLGASLERHRVQGTQLKELCIAELHALGVVDSVDQQMLLHEIAALQSPLDYWTTS